MVKVGEEEQEDEEEAGPSGVVDSDVTKPLEPAFEQPQEPMDMFPGKVEKLLNSISKVREPQSCSISVSNSDSESASSDAKI